MQFRNPLFAVLTLAVMTSLPACDSGKKDEPVAKKDTPDAKAEEDKAPVASPEDQKEADGVLAEAPSGLDPKVADRKSVV